MMRDDELKQVLRKWEAPQPSESLDQRVMASWAARPKPVAWKMWGAIAAGLVVLVGARFVGSAGKSQPTGDRTHVETKLMTEGFLPIPDGEIRVIRVGAKK